MDKPNCYKCKYRGTIPGDAHSMCLHPKTGLKDGDIFGGIEAILTGRTLSGAAELGIQANAHGVHSGWFMWPGNFDPVWLESCKGFESKEK